MRVLLVQPPQPLWPYINEQDNYLLPQWMVCLGAVLRRAGLEVHLLDCMPERVGWHSLEARIRGLRPDLVATGENHALFASVVMRLVRMVKEIDSGIVTVVGGGHFTNTVEHYLPGEGSIDFIVRGEGELTMLELAQAVEQGGVEQARAVPGVAYADGGEVRYSEPRELVEDLDSLPMPAYDMLPLGRYGRARYLFSPGGVTVHHSRGCTGSCRFCAWWRQMARRKVTDEGGCRSERLVPAWRTKSVDRTLAEMEILYKQYDKRCLVFVDPTFNVDPKWNDAFATALMRRNWDLTWFAFMRADFILRDEQLGVFEKLVRSGLVHLCIGVERRDDAQLDSWSKPGARVDDYERCFDLLHDKYPQVFRQATFIVGTRTESAESMKAQLAYARRIRADYPAFHPVTPFPGTDLYDELRHSGRLKIDDFDCFDMMTAILDTDHLTRDEVEEWLVRLNKEYVGVRWLAKGLLSRSSYRRDMYIWWLLVTGRVFADAVKRKVNPLSPEPYTSAFTPDWYER